MSVTGQREKPATARDDTPQPGLSPADVVRSVIERWKGIGAGVVLVTGVVTLALLLWRRPYEASITLAPVTTTKQLTGTLASSLLNPNPTGVQATPAFIVKLLRLHAVASEIALTPAPGSAETLIERLTKQRLPQPDNRLVDDVVGETIDAIIDRETGTIMLRVVHRDSAVARAVVDAAVGAVTRAFQSAARAQGTELRRAQEARVDSAAKQLHAAEDQLISFLSANREITPYSVTSVERQRLEMGAQLARTVYMQAVADREAAVAKELEQTPAVVVLDPLPNRLSHPPRRLALILPLSAFLTAVLLISVLVLRAWWAALRTSQDPSVAALVEALERFSWLRRRGRAA